MNKFSDLPEVFLKEGRCIQKYASGSSMLPTIPDGAVVKIEPIGEDTPGPGDIVYFTDNNGDTRIHRVSLIVKQSKDTLIQTWGDNCDKPDALIRRSQVLGRVVAYKVESEWYHVSSRFVLYIKYFLSRYLGYYLKRLPAKLLSYSKL